MQTGVNINELTSNLDYHDGIYYARKKQAISYPASGNENCKQLEEISFWFKHRNNCIRDVVTRYSRDRVFWDIGGGNGFVSTFLQSAGIETILVEPGEQGAANAKNRGLKNIICSSLEEAGIRDSTIASAGLFDVLEHIETDAEFLTKIKALLVPGGYLYLTVPAYNILWSNEDRDAGHFRRYTLTKLEKLLENCGFKIEYGTYFFSFLLLPIFLFRTIPSILGLNRQSSDVKKYTKEHSASRLQPLLDKICAWEENQILRSKKIALGGSCLIVAKKP
jgi:2-polyprenyl-3-methyl-5-hydroxy-6-metoxy-1,4-benzoquinol methylase